MQIYKKFLLSVLTTSLALSSCGTPFLYEPPKAEYLKAFKTSQLSDSNNQFSLDLFKNIYNQNNTFISPLSASVLLNMLLNGTKGNSLRDLKSILNTKDNNLSVLNKANQTLLKSLQTADSDVTLRIGNSLWLNQRKFDQRHLTWKEGQISTIEQLFLAQVNNLDFEKGEASQMNEWARKATDEKISKLVEPDKVKGFLMFLLNAIYFKANWSTQFEKSNTRKRPFFLRENEMRNLDFMHQTESFDYADIIWDSNKTAQIIELPYGKSKRLGLNIILPKNHQLQSMIENMTLENIKKWRSQMVSNELTLALPKFKFEKNYDLKDPLKELGLNRIFDPCDADFTGWFEQLQKPETSGGCSTLGKVDALAHIGIATQSTFIQVNEEGTEAAVITNFGFGDLPSTPTPPIEIAIDRPFFFMIYDKLTESIVFTGAVHNPEK